MKTYFSFLSSASLFKNNETRERTIEPITADKNPSISKPGTIKLTPHKRNTLIKNAATPRVIIVNGIKMI